MTGALYTWLLDTTLKGSILILVVAIIQRLIGSRVDARWRHVLWIVVLIRLVMPVAPSSSVSMFNLMPAADPVVMPHRAVVDAPVIANRPALREMVRVRFERERSIIPWVVGIWLAGALVFALRAGIAALRMHRAIPESREPRAESPIPIIESDAVRTPALHGVLRPVLLLPRGFTTTFTADELRHVILHELWHVRRMDVAVSWLFAVAQCLHWFNPLVWFAGSRIREERELACDELALSLLEEEERPDYGRTILKLLERFRPASPLPAVVGIVDRKERMKRRLMMIASFRNGTRFTALFLSLACAVAVAGLTDGETRQRKFIKKLDPAAHATVEKLRERVTFELTGASLNDLLGAISNETGLTITQDPEIATQDVQNARFTITADNVPARMVLSEALRPFELSAEPTAGGVTIAKGADRRHRILLRHGEEGEAGAGEGKRVVFVERKKLDGAEREEIEERVILKGRATGGEAGDHTSRRNLHVEIDENGVKSEGTLTIEIQKQ